MNIEILEKKEINQVEIPVVGFESDEDAYFERMNRSNLEEFMLFWHMRYYNAYTWHMMGYRIPPPPIYEPVLSGR